MAIAWLAVLRLLPWTDIIRNAPQVADGAKKLWHAVAKKTPTPVQPTQSSQPVPAPEVQTIAALQAQLAALESQVADLHNQMLASSELIKALADQHTQLIKHVETHRIRILWLTGATVVLGVIAGVSLALMLVRLDH